MKRILIALLFIVGFAVPAFAGDLDNAKQYWTVVGAQLGLDTVLQVTDTLYTAQVQGPILSAVNSCIRKWAAHLGVYARDTVRVLTDKHIYALSATFIEDGTTVKPFKVYGITRDSSEMYGLARAEDPTQMGNASFIGPSPTLYDIVDDHVWINYTPNLDLLSIYGPIAGLLMTDGADTTNVLDQDRSSICDCATALVAKQIELNEKADFYWERFVDHVIARGGSRPQTVWGQ